MADLISLSNPVFAAFTFYSAVLILKLCIMSVINSYLRVSRKVFVNPEDYKAFTGSATTKVRTDDLVNRVSRIHLNDLENIIPFIFAGIFYTMTSPPVATAIWHFRVFTAARLCHFVAYFIPLPQPSRALSFFAGWLVNVSMGVQIIMSTM